MRGQQAPSGAPFTVPDMSTTSGSTTSTGAIRGGDAWIVPHEPGGPVWVTASAPVITVLDRRAKPAAASAAVPAPAAAR